MQDLASNSDFTNLSPEAKKKVLSGLPGFPQSAEAQTKIYEQFGIKEPEKPKEPEGFWHSLGSGFGVDKESRDSRAKEMTEHPVKSMGSMPNPLLPIIPLNPVPMIKSMGKSFGKAHESEIRSAENFAKGDIKGGLAEKAGAFGHTVSAVAPGGETIEKSGEQFGDKNWKGGLGTALSVIGPILIGGAIKSKTGPLKPRAQLSKLVKATGETSGDMADNLNKVQSDLNETVSQNGLEHKTLGTTGDVQKEATGFYKTVVDTKQRISSQYNLGIQKLGGKEFMPTRTIAKLKELQDKFQKTGTADGKAQAAGIKRIIDTDYSHPKTAGALDADRWMQNGVAEGQYNKELTKQISGTAAGRDPAIAKVIADGLRDDLYEEILGKEQPGTNWREVKSKEGALLEIQSRLGKIIPDVHTKQLALEGGSRMPSASFSVHGGGITPRVHIASKMFPGKFGPEPTANRAVAKAFRGIEGKTPKKSLTPLNQSNVGQNPKPPSGPKGGNPPGATGNSGSKPPPSTPPGSTVGSAAASVADTNNFAAAKAKLGPNASLSEIAQEAQRMKTGNTSGSVSGKGSPDFKHQVFNGGDEITTSDGRTGKVIATHADGRSSLLVDFGKGKKETVWRENITSVKGQGGSTGQASKSKHAIMEKLEGTPEELKRMRDQMEGRNRHILDKLVEDTKNDPPLQQNQPKLTSLNAEHLKAGKPVSVKGKKGSIIGKHPGSGKITVKMEDGSIQRIDPSELNPRLTPLK